MSSRCCASVHVCRLEIVLASPLRGEVVEGCAALEMMHTILPKLSMQSSVKSHKQLHLRPEGRNARGSRTRLRGPEVLKSEAQ